MKPISSICRAACAALLATAGSAAMPAATVATVPTAAPAAVPASVPVTMLAWRMHAIGGPEVLALDRIPTPAPGAGSVLVQVRAAAVNPGDWKLHSGRLRIAPPLPHTMGADFAGVVATAGPGAGDWKRGDAVYGFVSLATGGAEAQYVVAQATDLRRKPPTLSFAAAAAIPVAALTAWKSLFEIAALHAGQRVLVQGASGAVGSAAVQLAVRAGAQVAGTASAKHLDYLRALGARVVIDYRAQRFEDVISDYDLVLDTVGGDTTNRSLAALRDGGTLVTLSSVADPAQCAARRIRCVFNMSFVPKGPGFDAIDDLVQRGRLAIPVGREFALQDAAAALDAVRRGGEHGRIVLTMDAAP